MGSRTQLPGSAQGTRGRERAHAGTQMHADLKGARGANAHKGTRTTNTGKGVQGASRHNPTGGNCRTRRSTRHTRMSMKPSYTHRDTQGHTDTCKIQTHTTSKGQEECPQN